jgi:predicted nucleotidyltransferase
MRERETGGRPAPQKDQVAVALKALEPELRKRGIVSLALFGSLVRGEAQLNSDIDVLVEIDPAADFDLLDLVGVRNLIGDRLDHKVDIVEKASLKPPLRDGILAEAERVF